MRRKKWRRLTVRAVKSLIAMENQAEQELEKGEEEMARREEAAKRPASLAKADRFADMLWRTD